MSREAGSKRTSNESLALKNLHPYVIAESDIRDYVNSVGIHDLRTVAARFQIVADLTSNAFEESKDQLKPTEQRLIKRIADEDNGERYRRIMRAIVAGVGQGRHGINAAHLTATAVVGMTFRWSREYGSALEDYRNDLRSKTQHKQSVSPRGPGNRSASRLANDRRRR